MKTSSKSRLVRGGRRQTAPRFGLSERHILTIERLVLQPETLLGKTCIADQFDPAFFKTDFWFMWCTTFAFQPWHSAVELKRYLARFVHMVEGFSRLNGIMRTVYNQYDSMVNGKDCVERIVYERGGTAGEIKVGPGDYVLVTLGSMTEASSLGTMDAAPVPSKKRDGGAWPLWETMAANRAAFGRPSVFADHVEQSKWVSFTTTLHDPAFLALVQNITGNVPGEGGLITFPESGWLASIVIPHQPHFIGQPKDVGVFWGYGLSVERDGDFVRKPMSACSGGEIMTEILGHLRIESEAAAILYTCISFLA